MIKVTDKFTAATVANILTDAKEVEYNYGVNNLSTSATVATTLDRMQEKFANTVMLGEETVGEYADWEVGTAEQYVNNRISQVEASINNKLELLSKTISAYNGNKIVITRHISDITKPESDVIYRIVGLDHYDDYMLDTNTSGGELVKMATFSFPGVAVNPRPGENNLITSGGIFDFTMKRNQTIDVTKFMNGAEYSSLQDALSGVPDDYQSGGAVVRFLENGKGGKKYKTCFNTASGWSTDVSDWLQITGDAEFEDNKIMTAGAVMNELKINGSAYDASNCGFVGYRNLNDAIDSIPLEYRRGGMHLRYFDTTDSVYKEYFCKTDTFSKNIRMWLSLTSPTTISINGKGYLTGSMMVTTIGSNGLCLGAGGSDGITEDQKEHYGISDYETSADLSVARVVKTLLDYDSANVCANKNSNITDELFNCGLVSYALKNSVTLPGDSSSVQYEWNANTIECPMTDSLSAINVNNIGSFDAYLNGYAVHIDAINGFMSLLNEQSSDITFNAGTLITRRAFERVEEAYNGTMTAPITGSYGLILQLFQNNNGSTPEEIVNYFDLCIKASGCMWFVCLDSNSSMMTSGASETEEVVHLLKKKYGSRFLDHKSYMCSVKALIDMGITPTSEDLERISQGLLPSSFLHGNDDINAQGIECLGQYIAMAVNTMLP